MFGGNKINSDYKFWNIFNKAFKILLRIRNHSETADAILLADEQKNKKKNLCMVVHNLLFDLNDPYDISHDILNFKTTKLTNQIEKYKILKLETEVNSVEY